MTAVERELLLSLVDKETLEKASLNNRAYAVKQVNEIRRLEENKPTVIPTNPMQVVQIMGDINVIRAKIQQLYQAEDHSASDNLSDVPSEHEE